MANEQEVKAESGDIFEDLRKSAESLVGKLEQGDFKSAGEVIQALNESRDRGIYREVGRLTRGIHNAIKDFQVDVSQYGVQGHSDSEMTNAQDRLDHVIKLTQDAANTTMDMVEEGIPMATDLSNEAHILREDWGRLIRREMEPGEFRELYKRVDGFLEQTSGCAGMLTDKLNAILLAQGYQDLTGQIIQKVITLVQQVERQLVDLVRIASQVEEITGIVTEGEGRNSKAEGLKDITPEGPQIKAEQRADVVSGQDDVDDLLSSLGF